MPLTGELSDLSLAELIEFFCNQRKTGCLKVSYAIGAGYFYLKAGAVIHARFGDLRGIDAVYYALTQPNASFTFTPAIDAPEHTINQPWTSVVLEGLRRMDEGVTSPGPSPHSFEGKKDVVRQTPAAAVSMTKPAPRAEKAAAAVTAKDDVKAFGVLLSSSDTESFARRRWRPTMVLAAVVALIAMVGVPWGWYKHKNRAISMSDASAATPPAPAPQTTDTPNNVQPETVQAQAEPSPAADESDMAKRQREARARERAKAAEQAAAANNAAKPAANAGNAATSASNKRAMVTVTYDENGRVTAASGGDATALRIARQKRFPPGKPGSATITIPIN
jgi:hypothetical protein